MLEEPVVFVLDPAHLLMKLNEKQFFVYNDDK